MTSILQQLKLAGSKPSSVLTALRLARNATHTHPTPGQAAAGNYSKGELVLHDMRIKLENPKGTERRGYDSEGRETWKRLMVADYGYFVSTKAADSDAVDVFIGPDHDSEFAAVVAQNDSSGKFDELKVMLCYANIDAAKKAYLSHYPKGWESHIRDITPTTVQALKQWLRSGDTQGTYNPPAAREKAASGISGVAADERSMLQSKKPQIPALRGAGNHSMPALVSQLPSFLGRYVSKAAGFGGGNTDDTGARQWRSRLLSGKLPVDSKRRTESESSQQHFLHVSGGAPSVARMGASNRYFENHLKRETAKIGMERGESADHAQWKGAKDHYALADLRGGVLSAMRLSTVSRYSSTAAGESLKERLEASPSPHGTRCEKVANGAPGFWRSLSVGALGSVPGAGLGVLSALGLEKALDIKDPERQGILKAILGAAGGALGGATAREIDGQYDTRQWDAKGRKIPRKGTTDLADSATRVVEGTLGFPIPKAASIRLLKLLPMRNVIGAEGDIHRSFGNIYNGRGYIATARVARHGAPKDAFSRGLTDDALQIAQSMIYPELRGMGIGRKLYGGMFHKALEGHLQGSGINYVQSHASKISEAAKRVWESMMRRGYPITKLLNNAYSLDLAELAKARPGVGKFMNSVQSAMSKKASATPILDRLIKAKEHSDAKRYTAKHSILRQVIGEAPDEFFVDSPGGPHPGLTHRPTNFRIHAPKAIAAGATGLTPLQAMLADIQGKLDKEKLDYFLVAGRGDTDGASVFKSTGPGGAARHARDAHMAWEKERGIDSEHDWSKELQKAADERLVHYSRDKHTQLRPLTYKELQADRTSGRWARKPELAQAYTDDRRKFERELHSRLERKGVPTDKALSFLYATLEGKERFGKPGSYKHTASLDEETIGRSFFDVVGDGKNRTVLGQPGLKQALKRWQAASDSDSLQESEYMGMKILPRIEVITGATVTPDSIEKSALSLLFPVAPTILGNLGLDKSATLRSDRWERLCERRGQCTECRKPNLPENMQCTCAQTKQAAEIVRKPRTEYDDHCPHCDHQFHEKGYPGPKYTGQTDEEWKAMLDSDEYDDVCPHCDGIIDRKEQTDEEINSPWLSYPGSKEKAIKRREIIRRRKAERLHKAERCPHGVNTPFNSCDECGKEKEAAAKPSKGCLMLTIPDTEAAKIRAWGKENIPNDQLAEEGFETEIHTTVLYGFGPDVELKTLLPHLTFGVPIQIGLGKIKRFKADANRPSSDVLVIEAHGDRNSKPGDELTQLNAKLKKEFEVTSTYKGYNAHVTIAYVKPGALPELDGQAPFDGTEIHCGRMVYSTGAEDARVKTDIFLTEPSDEEEKARVHHFKRFCPECHGLSTCKCRSKKHTIAPQTCYKCKKPEKTASVLGLILKEAKAMTREELLSRGSCCGNHCQACPYEPRWQQGAAIKREHKEEKPESVLDTLGLASKTTLE